MITGSSLIRLQKRELGATEILGEADKSKLCQAGEALSHTYLETLAKFLNIKVRCGKSGLVSTFGESIVDFVLLGIKEKNVLLLETDFSIPKDSIKGSFIFLLAVKSIDKFLKAIEKKV